MLKWDEIEHYVAHPENIRESDFLECKAASNNLPKDIWKTISAFSNTNGGVILLGLIEDNTNKSKFIKDGVENAQKIIDDLFSQKSKVSYFSICNEDVKIIEDNIIAIYIRKPPNQFLPVYLNNDIAQSFIRQNTGDHKMTLDEIRNFLSSYSGLNKDSALVNYTSIDDINIDTLNKYRQYLKSQSSSNKLLQLDDRELLKKINAISKDNKTGKELLTVAGCLMFGKIEIIRSIPGLSHYLLDYQEQNNTINNRYTRRVLCDDLDNGNLFDFYLEVSPMIFDISKNDSFMLDNLTRTEENLITEALREALINTLTHADYYNSTVVIRIVKNQNKIEFQNPGTMLVSVESAKEGKESITRNSILHNMFRRIGLCERQGKGVETIFQNWKTETLTNPDLQTSYDGTTLSLILQDSDFILAKKQLSNYFGQRFDSLDKKLYKDILILAVKNNGIINHSVLKDSLDSSYHSREITLALSKLIRESFLIGAGVNKDKIYILPWKSLPKKYSSSIDEVFEDRKKDDKGRIVIKDGLVINTLTYLDSDYLDELRNIIDNSFYNSKRKSTTELEKYISILCNQQFVSRNVLSHILGIGGSALGKHLKRLTKEGKIELLFPQNITHEAQSYRWVND